MNFPSIRQISNLCLFAGTIFLGACKSSSPYGVVDYTTPNTKLSKDEYPFDDKGNYREDWVSGSSSSRSASLSSSKPTASTSNVGFSATPVETNPYVIATPTPSSPSSVTKPKPAEASPKPKPKPKPKPTAVVKPKPKPKPKLAPKAKPKPKPKPTPPKPTLYKIKSGDTLSALSRRTGHSVATLKGYNNMKSDLLRDGWVIKIPPKK